jgi:lambda family phage portal protein
MHQAINRKKISTGLQKICDEIINIFSPSSALERQQARNLMSNGAYDSGSITSAVFQEYITTVTDADSSVLYDRDRIIARSRDNVRNVPIAKGIIDRTCDHAIGDRGLALHPQIDKEFLGKTTEEAVLWENQAEQEWKYFSESKESDYNRILNVAEKTKLTLQSELEGGDCFTILTNVKRSGSEYDLKLQSVEGEYVNNPQYNQNSDTLIDGVEKNEKGWPIKYHFSKYHPGDRINSQSNKWVSRNIFNSLGQRKILHHYNTIRFGQTRGLPILGTVTSKLLQIGRLSDAELMASVINAYHTIFIQGEAKDTTFTKKSPESNSVLTENSKLTLGSGTVVRVKPNTKIESFDPKRPNLAFIDFFTSIVAEIGAAVGVPRSLILMQFDKSYSASRGEVLLAWVYFLTKRTS